jgi:hypothetical protein
MLLIPGFLVPVVVSLGLASVFIDDTYWKSEGDPPAGIGFWVLAAFFLAAWLGLRHVVPILRGGFFWQTAVLLAAFGASAAVAPTVPSVVSGLVMLALLVGLHATRLAIEIVLAERRYA